MPALRAFKKLSHAEAQRSRRRGLAWRPPALFTQLSPINCSTRPGSELYDNENDSREFKNLAKDSARGHARRNEAATAGRRSGTDGELIREGEAPAEPRRR